MTTDPDRSLTWATLLGGWTAIAKAAVALPDDAAGARWKQSVPAVIDLQATVHALAELSRLPGSHRAAAIDTAEALITRRTDELRQLWHEADQPEGITDALIDAHAAVRAAREHYSA